MLEEMTNAGNVRSKLKRLRWLLVTGEALPPELSRQWLRVCPQIPLLNAYGPTECSDDVTHHVVDLPPAGSVARMPIGRPIANMHMYVLDQNLAPVPVGVFGELCVGGIGVGRGYLYDPARTAEVFIADPFSDEPGARLYKTGDLVRYLPNADIEFMGRLDQQVKVRGFRVELGEIEAVLASHVAVRDCVVVTKANENEQQRLVAYVVMTQESPVLAGELRVFVKHHLPEYMVPAAFVMLEALPLTPNGKVDRQALPEPDISPELAGSYATPRTPVEEILTKVWSDVLELDRVGIYDNFFEIGGHSLLAMTIVAIVREKLEIELPLRRMFEEPTVAGLALVVEQIRSEQPGGSPTYINIVSQNNGEELLGRLDHLSDEQVNLLLTEMLEAAQT
jgi:acyl carrier protein